MPGQHREFFAMLPYLFVAAADEIGWPLASVLTGDAGFVTSPDPTTLRIAAQPDAGDPISAGLRAGAEIGLLGLDLSNRRRNRANGRVIRIDDGITVAVAQSFGNCAQYIQTRRPTAHPQKSRPARALGSLDAAARATISAADTFFIASRSRDGVANGGFDVSHRGGRPGFVKIEQDELVVPDFRGNRFFNTLGNLLGDPRAGLLFVDFSNGGLLQVQGTVNIAWNTGADAPAGAQRLWRCRIERAWYRPQAFPFDWQFGEFAPTTLATGAWTGGA